MKGYGDKLKALRGKRTMQKVSDDTGIGRSALSMYEREARIPRDEIKIKLSRYYGKSVEYIFFSKNATDSGLKGCEANA